jgi:2-polyprenyl-3-methyl-5-hydroxy-6-metoxy-1,4-benzoquinol methylase
VVARPGRLNVASTVTSTNYSAEFFAARQDGSRRSAEAILTIVMDLLHPSSAIDVGCGTGAWTHTLLREITDVVGVDGEWVPPAARGPWFMSHDLEQPLRLERRFDLAISVEVAEHLSQPRASGFVGDLVKLAPAVLFSAAIPAQGGADHRNEQWQSYWAALFRTHGFYPHDLIRPKVWHNTAVEPWYAQNALIYLRDEAAPAILDIVHPTLYERALRARTPSAWLRRGVRKIRTLGRDYRGRLPSRSSRSAPQ